MDEVKSKLTVFFEDPFYVGVIERKYKKRLEVVKVTFGKEPTDGEILEYLNNNYSKLKFIKADDTYIKKDISELSPKRLKRMVGKEMKKKSISTKSQDLLKKQYEERKLEVKSKNREEKKQKEESLFELRQMKKKKKHKGR
ncbi:YjdF family protein [Anaerofustis stercorihominis]|uniref:YjdF family protein n=1 Tax=Anaerofustis stercorihominis TaxID=214853 RepID=UPI00214BBDB4|nr:YjdF family protein [Anaerofustis stercorihominis]MCR2032351.1 YjdF family protein [Anaerofustis stercorihominis]